MKTAYAIPTAHIDAYISEMRRRLLTKQIGDSPCIFSFFPNFNFFGAYKDFVGLALRFPEHAAKKWPQIRLHGYELVSEAKNRMPTADRCASPKLLLFA